LKLLDDTNPSSVIPTSDSTGGGFSGIDSRYMNKAALYARVSTEAQQKEGTIESQIAELKRQIAAAGHELVKEYIDDGHSGGSLDRPALDELRGALKTDAFSMVYFLCADRIARDLTHQNIIVSELLKHKKRIVISGKDYEENPENKFSLTVFGAVAEFERAKIRERMQRGRLHKLRMGQIVSDGCPRTYGYHYMKKTPTSPPALVINEEEAKIVRWIFEAYVGGLPLSHFPINLEERGILTKTGKLVWKQDHIRMMLKNETYTGIKYFNKTIQIKETLPNGRHTKTPKRAYRNRDEWIAVQVPAIISRELFERAQQRLCHFAGRYRKPAVKYLLSGLVRCSDCGRLYQSVYSYGKIIRPSGRVRVYHRGQYVCNGTWHGYGHHAKSGFQRCRNGRSATHLLDAKIVELIRGVMLNPEKLAQCVESGQYVDDPTAARDFSRIAAEINALEGKRRRLIELYASGQTPSADYVKASRELDEAISCLNDEKAKLANAKGNAGRQEVAGASIRQFCNSARARFEACADFEAKRQFLRDHVERIVFNRHKVTILGSAPVQSAIAKETKLTFRIEGEINRWIIRSRAWRKLPPPDERTSSWIPAVAHSV